VDQSSREKRSASVAIVFIACTILADQPDGAFRCSRGSDLDRGRRIDAGPEVLDVELLAAGLEVLE
jgi:hypothetical protein